jgi:homoaconitase/3-isopropylmalate dehydratase large subunit
MPDSQRDSGRFTSAYWAELKKMRKDLKSFIVPPDQPTNLSSGLSPKARRTMTNLDKEFLGSKTSSRSSRRTKDLRAMKDILKKYDNPTSGRVRENRRRPKKK